MATVLIGADLCPIGANREYFEQGNAEALFGDLLPEITAADLMTANLECPLIRKPSPIRKTGPVFGANPKCIEAVRAAGIRVLCLANNHILDHGADGLRSTLEACHQAGIATVGAGRNARAASQPLVMDLKGLKVALLAFAEHEFSIAGPSSPGASPLDWITLVRIVREQAAGWDHWIVLYHGAVEFQPVTPRVQRLCRFLMDLGATAVVVQHPHTLGGWERYRHGYIVYGQGALVMDEPIYRDNAGFHEGFLVKLHLQSQRQVDMECVPFCQSKPPPGVRLLGPVEAASWQERMQLRSIQVSDPSFVESEWLRFCAAIRHNALSTVLGHGRFLSWLNRKGWVERFLVGEKRMRGMRNMVVCETHREVLETVFRHWWYPPEGGEA